MGKKKKILSVLTAASLAISSIVPFSTGAFAAESLPDYALFKVSDGIYVIDPSDTGIKHYLYNYDADKMDSADYYVERMIIEYNSYSADADPDYWWCYYDYPYAPMRYYCSQHDSMEYYLTNYNIRSLSTTVDEDQTSYHRRGETAIQSGYQNSVSNYSEVVSKPLLFYSVTQPQQLESVIVDSLKPSFL